MFPFLSSLYLIFAMSFLKILRAKTPLYLFSLHVCLSFKVIHLIGWWLDGKYETNVTLLVIFFISILIMTKLVELFGGRKKSTTLFCSSHVAVFLYWVSLQGSCLLIIGKKNQVILELLLMSLAVRNTVLLWLH